MFTTRGWRGLFSILPRPPPPYKFGALALSTLGEAPEPLSHSNAGCRKWEDRPTLGVGGLSSPYGFKSHRRDYFFILIHVGVTALDAARPALAPAQRFDKLDSRKLIGACLWQRGHNRRLVGTCLSLSLCHDHNLIYLDTFLGRAGFPADPDAGDAILKKSKKTAKPRGPKPEVLKIEGDWKDAMRKLISKKRPVGGWPKPTNG